METIYDVLSAEHDQVADLLQQATCNGSRESLLKVKAKTDLHMAGEEKLFYPLLQQKDELCDLVKHAFKEHKESKTVISELERMDESDHNWTSKVEKRNEKKIDHQVQEEENKVFPAAQKVLSQDKAQEIAQQCL